MVLARGINQIKSNQLNSTHNIIFYQGKSKFHPISSYKILVSCIIIFSHSFSVLYTHPFDWNACIHTIEFWNLKSDSRRDGCSRRSFFSSDRSSYFSSISFSSPVFFVSLQFTFFDWVFLWFLAPFHLFCCHSFVFEFLFFFCTSHHAQLLNKH